MVENDSAVSSFDLFFTKVYPRFNAMPSRPTTAICPLLVGRASKKSAYEHSYWKNCNRAGVAGVNAGGHDAKMAPVSVVAVHGATACRSLDQCAK